MGCEYGVPNGQRRCRPRPPAAAGSDVHHIWGDPQVLNRSRLQTVTTCTCRYLVEAHAAGSLLRQPLARGVAVGRALHLRPAVHDGLRTALPAGRPRSHHVRGQLRDYAVLSEGRRSTSPLQPAVSARDGCDVQRPGASVVADDRRRNERSRRFHAGRVSLWNRSDGARAVDGARETPAQLCPLSRRCGR